MQTSTYFQHPFCTVIACGISSSNDGTCKQQLQEEQCEDGVPNTSLLADELQKQWHAKLNLHLGKICIRPGSKHKALVKGKARTNSGCPKCAKAHAGREADGTRQKHPTFTEANHALLQQWDHDRNRESGTHPDNTTLQSGKLIWWCCHACPKGKKLCECNSLETVCPDIAADFDVEKNGVTAAEVTSSASTKYSWLSDEPGAKKRSVAQRTSYTRKQLLTEARRS
ncbi:MAG: hypothetical protein FRX49_09233 [Trebouxia sp. A1-2]|nr:MAG: hypothetical protein FRX49_09233 [Trebouxia sp. A1-2]